MLGRLSDRLHRPRNRRGPVRWVGLGVVELEARGVEALHEGNVEHIDPDHGLAAIVTVIVPGAIRREDQIPAGHPQLLAGHHREPAVSLEGEAAGRCDASSPSCRPGLSYENCPFNREGVAYIKKVIQEFKSNKRLILYLGVAHDNASRIPAGLTITVPEFASKWDERGGWRPPGQHLELHREGPPDVEAGSSGVLRFICFDQ